MKNLGDRIKLLRTTKNLSQKDFANRIMVTQSYLSRIERNVEKPTPKLLRLIAFEFDISLTWLSTGDGDINSMYDEEHEYSQAFQEGSIEALELFEKELNEIIDVDLHNSFQTFLYSIIKYINFGKGTNAFKTQVISSFLNGMLCILELLIDIEKDPNQETLYKKLFISKTELNETINNILSIYLQRFKE